MNTIKLFTSKIQHVTKVALLILFVSVLSLGEALAKNKILVFYKTAGFHHSSIPVGVATFIKMGEQHKFSVDTTTNAEKFTAANLKQYAAVVFLNTTGDVLNGAQQQAFEKYIQSGRGYMGVHAAADTEYGWPWYNKLVGAYFKSHPEQQMATLQVVNRNTIATKHLPVEWKRKDEWYNYKSIAPGLNILIKLDESSYKGGENNGDHPISWYHDFDGGRAFYTGLGHTDESYAELLFLEHLWGGLKYAMGKKMKS